MLVQSASDIWVREFPGGLVVRIQSFHLCSPGSVPGLGTEILHKAAAKESKQKQKQKNHVGETE